MKHAKILTVVPARAGSQRVPNKNRQLVGELPMVVRAAKCGVGDVVVSTDDITMPTGGAMIVHRPPHLSGSHADIADAVRHATDCTEVLTDKRYDYVVTLQPSVLARTPAMVQMLVDRVIEWQAGGGLTMAETVPWIWRLDDGEASNGWSPGPYPRSQDSATTLAEANTIQVASRAAVADGRRWDLPLVVCTLPSWATALDVDTEEDLETARRMWPWACGELHGWRPRWHLIRAVNGMAEL